MEVRSVEAIIAALNNARAQYLIVGGLAVNAHGYERLTRDVDLVIGLEPDNIVRGLHALQEIGYRMSIPVTPEQFADVRQREMWRKEKDMIVLKLWSDMHRRTPVDVFVFEPFDFAHELAAAKREIIMGGLSAPVVAYETLLAMKSAAGREKGLARRSCAAEIGSLPAMTKEELYAHPGWQWCTSEGAELHTLLIGLETTFREKLEWLEEAETLTLQLRANRESENGTAGAVA